jgi:hypothetical protein
MKCSNKISTVIRHADSIIIEIGLNFSNVTQDMYTIKDLQKVLGIKRERIRGWMKNGFFRPSIQISKSKGRGEESQHIFSATDVREMILFIGLIEEGFSCVLAYRIAKGLC